jgi:hypothetical protein
MSFDNNLKDGRVAESKIARWLMRRGFCVLPVYDVAEQQHKGPQLFSCDGEFVAPDMLALKMGGPILFVEAKCKAGWTHYHKEDRVETGIDWRHYLDYQKVAARTGLPLWILFLQNGQQTKGTRLDERTSRTGLYGNEIANLDARQSHRDNRWGDGGMVYWSPDYPARDPALRLIARYEDVA